MVGAREERRGEGRGVRHAGRWVGVWVGLVEPVGLGFGGVSLSLGVLAGVGIGIPVRLLGVGSAGAGGVGLPTGVLLEQSNLGFQAGYILGTGGEMQLEEAVGDHHHAVACEVVEGVTHGQGVAYGAVGRGWGRGRRDSLGQG